MRASVPARPRRSPRRLLVDAAADRVLDRRAVGQPVGEVGHAPALVAQRQDRCAERSTGLERVAHVEQVGRLEPAAERGRAARALRTSWAPPSVTPASARAAGAPPAVISCRVGLGLELEARAQVERALLAEAEAGVSGQALEHLRELEDVESALVHATVIQASGHGSCP